MKKHIINMNVPSISFIDLHDPEYKFDNYWDKLSKCDIPLPKTRIIKLESVDDSEYPECPIEQIMNFMNSDCITNAFIRTGYKAAVDRFRDGSLISTNNKHKIEQTYDSLMTQHIRNNIPHGNILVIRDWIDLSYCLEPNHSHTFEIRYFIEDGSILYRTPEKYDEYRTECPQKFDYVNDNFKYVNHPVSYVEKVADKFQDSDHSWSVDVVLDSSGNWWVTEMHINGVYYNNERKKWMNVCGHSDKFYNSPKWIHSPHLIL
jgi:hypothetical protein